MLWQVIWSLIAGLVIGSLAKLAVPGRQNIPLWLTVLLGWGGAFLGNWMASAIGVRHTGGIDWIRHILQFGIAIVLIAVVAPAWGPASRKHMRSSR